MNALAIVDKSRKEKEVPLIVNNKAVVPHPGHWILSHPEGGFEVRHPELGQVYKQMRAYCAANKKSVPTMQEMDAWICEQQPQQCVNTDMRAAIQMEGFSETEINQLLPELDATLLGNRLAALTSALGLPPCAGCSKRQDWLNRAHQWLRDHI